MQKNILWTGVEYHSLKNCILITTGKGSEAASTIIGTYGETIYKADYEIRTNKKWGTVFFEIKTQLNNKTATINYKSDGKGNWLKNGKAVKILNGCIDIDFSLTPFTNTLAINWLKLSEKKEQVIKVLYVDILGRQTKAVKQKYTRLSKTGYKYENVPNDFQAILSVDELGLMVKYPGLFKRTGIVKSNYSKFNT